MRHAEIGVPLVFPTTSKVKMMKLKIFDIFKFHQHAGWRQVYLQVPQHGDQIKGALVIGSLDLLSACCYFSIQPTSRPESPNLLKRLNSLPQVFLATRFENLFLLLMMLPI